MALIHINEMHCGYRMFKSLYGNQLNSPVSDENTNGALLRNLIRDGFKMTQWPVYKALSVYKNKDSSVPV